MRPFTVIVGQDPTTQFYVGHVVGWPGAHSQGTTLGELRRNLAEVIAMLLADEEGSPSGDRPR